jgi:hypothetical protein
LGTDLFTIHYSETCEEYQWQHDRIRCKKTLKLPSSALLHHKTDVVLGHIAASEHLSTFKQKVPTIRIRLERDNGD